MTVLDSVHSFLKSKRDKHNDPALIDRVLQFDFELQINVITAGMKSVPDHKGWFTDGKHTFWPIRIPKAANDVPHFNDYELRWPLQDYCESVGTTGWDWIDQCSRWVAFDLDSIVGHADGLPVHDLELARQHACELPYVECRRSTSGRGYHLWVALNEIQTRNHTCHARLAQRVLRKMSHDAKFKFSDSFDVVGNNFWIWSRKATPENGGLSLIKAAC
jgi:hypothetical protein